MELTEREWEIVRRALFAYTGEPGGDSYLRDRQSTEARYLYHRLMDIPVR